MATGATPEATEPLRFSSPAGRWALIGTVLGSGMTMIDGTVVQIALPRIAADLDADFAGLQWVVNGFTLALASLILLGGSLGDRLGRRRVFTVGVVWFTVASALCALAPDIRVLVAARVLQGIGGALLVPGSLAILQASFHPDDRARAIGAWSGLGGIAAAIGPFVGGYLIDVASWRWIFLLNLPLGAVVIYVAFAHLPESRDPTVKGPLDLVGAVLGAAGLAGITFGFIQQQAAVGVVGAAIMVGFVVSQARRRHALVDLTIFRSRQFSAANGVTFLLYGAFGMALFLVGLVLQQALGYSPLAAGAALLPITLVMLAFSARSGDLAQRIGPRLPMTLGPLVMAGGLALMLRIRPGGSYLSTVLPALGTFATGLVLTVAPLTATALAAADARLAGLASGVNNAVARTGQLLFVALIPLVAGFPVGVAVGPADLVDGFHRVALVAAAAMVSAAAVSWTFVRTDVLAAEAGPGEGDAAEPRPRSTYHCATDAPPLAPEEPVPLER